MVKESFYEVLNSNNYDKEKFGKLLFRMEEGGPQYKVIPGEKYSNIKDSIKKDDFILKMIIPREQEITDNKRKKEMLEQFFHNGKKF